MKALIIVPYFGKLPNTFPLWLHSVSKNSDFEWLLITDDKSSFNYPTNLKVEYWEFNNFKEFVQNKFDFKIALSSAYKICDFRPAFGHIFSDYLTNYDFWGFSDTDVVYGDLKKFITKPILEKYNRIYPTGHLSLFRNSTEVNNYYKIKSSNFPYYKDVFVNEDNMCFDEWPGISSILKELNLLQYTKEDMADIKWNAFSQLLVTQGLQNYRDQKFYYKDGDVYRIYDQDKKMIKESFAYYHYQKRIMDIQFNDENEYLISPYSFIGFHQDFSRSYLKKINFYSKVFLRRFKNLKKKLLK